MLISIRAKVLLTGTCLLAGASAWGQQAQSQATPTAGSLDVAVVYNPLMANVVGGNGFWMQGGSVQVHGQFWRGLHGQFWQGLGVVADVSGLHAAHMNGSGVGLDMVTVVFGPRYTWSPPHRRYSLFGQVLAGGAHGLNSIFPAFNTIYPTSPAEVERANSVALYVGGGANVHLSPRLAVRAFEVDWLRTEMPNNTTGVQNNLRLGAGLIFNFKWGEK
jgi:hypothetical protein